MSIQDTFVFDKDREVVLFYQGYVNSIAEKNKITFASEASAEATSHTLATNCKKPQDAICY